MEKWGGKRFFYTTFLTCDLLPLTYDLHISLTECRLECYLHTKCGDDISITFQDMDKNVELKLLKSIPKLVTLTFDL